MMTCEEQLKMWLEGEPVHNPDRDECCPDFSCCGSPMADDETRRLFCEAARAGNERVVNAMLIGFLGSYLSGSVKAYIAVGGHEEN